jgi:hypothetical protein
LRLRWGFETISNDKFAGHVPSGRKSSRLKKTLTCVDEFDNCRSLKACDNLQLASTSCKLQQALAI